MACRDEQDAVPGESWFGTSGSDDTESPSAAGVAPAENVDAEWLSEFLAPEAAEAFNPAWLELIEGAESAPEADLANLGLTTPGTEDTGHRSVHALEDEEIAAAHELAGAAEQLEGDDAPLQASPLPAGALNLKCGHVGYYGILGRRQKVPDPTAIPYRWVCQLIITRRDSNGKTTMVVGTGVLVSPRHVLTAAHWIKWAGKDDRGLWVTYETTGIRVVPGRYDDGTPLGAAFAKLNMKVASRWNPKAPNLQDDYALIELDTALGDAKPAALRGQKLCYWGSRAPARSCARSAAASSINCRAMAASPRATTKTASTCRSTQAEAG
jgi:V8-like Glu-specific endopeptidase